MREYPFVYAPRAVQYKLNAVLHSPGDVQEWDKCLRG